jgi:hypothetical protein
MKMLFSSQLSPEVGLLRELLEQSGIRCEVRNECAHENFPGAEFQPEIWVLHDADFEKACELRDAWRRSIPDQNDARGVGEATVPALRFVGGVCFASCAFMIWQGIRANNWVFPVIGIVLFGFFGFITFLAAGQLRPARPKRTAKRS